MYRNIHMHYLDLFVEAVIEEECNENLKMPHSIHNVKADKDNI